MTAPELLPCPFCGDNRASTYHVRDGRVSMCPACGAKSGSQFNGPLDLPSADDRAIAAWNRRTPSPEVAALIAESRRKGWNAAIEASAALVEGSVYTLNGGARTLEPVSPKMRGIDMHHATIAVAIRALKEETP
jgi:Lar family restriction alleviation protein